MTDTEYGQYLLKSIFANNPVRLIESLHIQPEAGKQIYFASDIHFGEPDYETTRERERLLIQWLEEVRPNASAIFFVGDTFDFWFEYDHVIPKGCTRFLGKLAQYCDEGLPIYVFTGNHDLWMRDYLEQEIGVRIFRDRVHLDYGARRLFIAHGDGLGPGDVKFKLLKKVFQSRFCQWLFKWLHPDIGIKIARLWSGRSRDSHDDSKFKELEEEWLVRYSKRKLEEAHFDYFVYGHRHFPVVHPIGKNANYVNLGDWIVHNTYAVLTEHELTLHKYDYE